ncbi:ABC transporter permease [Spirosoma endbachense]|uniref:FtsX-like permease family protein n=1 Tax=Spirosoma endbachense TaxID=2666025 RepID=A0A6P1VTB0_9BACT|nr:ABC transporter permease [Spirosoma endbachense]QHV95332.1 FtsX-like permease family protein [Spirosoma endbachense]
MFLNYIKIAWRNLIRNKTYSLLTLLGLASGMTCAMLLGLYVYDELTFDRYHTNAANIYRLNVHVKWGDNELNMGVGSAPMGPTLRQEFPEIRNVVRIIPSHDMLFRVGQKALYAKDFIYADSTLFSFFDYSFIDGIPRTALLQPNTIILTQKMALALFGRTNGLLSKVIEVKNEHPLTVSGIIQDPPANHHLSFEAVLPYVNRQLNEVNLDKWDNFGTSTYVLLQSNSDVRRLDHKMPAFYKKYIAQAIGDATGKGVTFDIRFQPLTDMHLHSSHLLGEEKGSNIAYVYTFSAIGLFILLIAIVNYVNLATARSTGRAREIGVRKAIGSLRTQLIGQFLTESTLLSLLALLTSLILVQVLLPLFNYIAAKSLLMDLWNSQIMGVLVGFSLLIGLVSGLYPAFLLSRFKPVAVLKGTFTASSSGILLRQSLVVFQFTVSSVMIVGTFVVYQQLQYMRHTQLGFNQEQVLVLPLKAPAIQRTATVLKDRFLRNPVIKGVSLTNGSVGGDMNDKSTFSFYAGGKEQSISTEYFSVDQDFVNVLQIGLKEGNNFSPELVNDSTDAVLVNEAMLKRLGWKNRKAGLVELDTKRIPIAGVIRDFHMRSLRNKIEPLVLVLNQDRGDKLLVRMAPQNVPGALAYIRSIYERVNPNQPFEYTFLDQTFAQQYRADERKGKLFLGFSGMAIFIACLGLFGLATFTAEQRRKEIGVRKVLGASVSSLVVLLSRDFLKLVFIALVLGTPLAYLAMKRWLADFAYRVELDWWMFALAGLLAVGIALFTISFQSIRAALVNPVKSLRSE